MMVRRQEALQVRRGRKGGRLRCPRCGKPVAPPTPQSPRCPRCRENLRKCRYCQFVDDRLWECTHPQVINIYGDEAGRFCIPEPDYYWRCPFYETKSGGGGEYLTVSQAALRIFLVVAAALAVFFFYLLPKARPPGVPLVTMQMEVPAEVRVNVPFVIYVHLRNWDEQESGPIAMRLEGNFWENASIISYLPVPSAQEATPKSLILHYPSLPGKGRLAVQMQVLPAQTGSFTMRIIPFYQGVVAGGRKKCQVQVKGEGV